VAISVFVSHPQPHMKRQQEFLDRVCDHLRDRDLDSRTLGRNEYGIREPLATIRALLTDCNGVLTIACRRSLVKEGEDRPASELPVKTKTS
jgi:hypothetical protein